MARNDIHIHVKPGGDVLLRILAKLDELGELMSALSDAVDAALAGEAEEDAAAAEVIAAKDAVIAELQAQLAASQANELAAMENDAAQEAEIAAKQSEIDALNADIQTQIDRLAGLNPAPTPEPTPEPPVEGGGEVPPQ